MVLSTEEGYRYVQLESSKTTDYLLLWVHNAREKVFEVPSTIIRMRKRESGEGRAMLSLRLQKRLLLLAQLFPSL